MFLPNEINLETKNLLKGPKREKVKRQSKERKINSLLEQLNDRCKDFHLREEDNNHQRIEEDV